MDLSNTTIGFSSPLFSILEGMLDFPEDQPEKSRNNPSRAFVRVAKAMAATPADVMEYSSAHVFIVDVPGIKAAEIKVQVEDDGVLVVSGERKRDKDNKEGSAFLALKISYFQYLLYLLPENVNKDTISAVCHNGVLIVKVKILPPAEPKKPKAIKVKVA
ncbi:Small heat shock protein HSP [Parasponia andersonii]|uniref:Small heat shock protein HSP n=1 Tax=Parasponia andersonii TaxID=3476 RepID=A0A2P5DEK5_PARAD|nr:Small heat shock protein HSP [Parasponia andersonii]